MADDDEDVDIFAAELEAAAFAAVSEEAALPKASATSAALTSTSNSAGHVAQVAASLAATSSIAVPSADAVMVEMGTAELIHQFVPQALWFSLAPTCKRWDDLLQKSTRSKAVDLLTSTASLSPAAASAVEAALYAGCGHRAGPGAYNDRLRMFVANLRLNKDLSKSLDDGSLTAHAFVRMTREEMMSQQRSLEVALMREKALAEAIRRDPPADYVDQFACGSCGCVKQWSRRHHRMGLLDKYSEVLVCCDCRRQVERKPIVKEEVAAHDGAASSSSASSAAKLLGAASASGAEIDNGDPGSHVVAAASSSSSSSSSAACDASGAGAQPAPSSSSSRLHLLFRRRFRTGIGFAGGSDRGDGDGGSVAAAASAAGMSDDMHAAPADVLEIAAAEAAQAAAAATASAAASSSLHSASKRARLHGGHGGDLCQYHKPGGGLAFSAAASSMSSSASGAGAPRSAAAADEEEDAAMAAAIAASLDDLDAALAAAAESAVR